MITKTLIIGLSLAGVSCCNNMNIYQKRMDDLNLELSLSRFSSLVDIYTKECVQYPSSLDEVFDFYNKDYPEEMEVIEQRHFLDPLSKSKEWVKYVPLYDSTDTKIESYLIISCGFDGVFDNDYNSLGKLHADDWKSKLKLYNPDEFDGTWNKAFIDYMLYAKESMRGGKDLLIYNRAFADY